MRKPTGQRYGKAAMVGEANEVGTEQLCRSADGMRRIVRLGRHGNWLKGWTEGQQDCSKELAGPKDLLAGRGTREVRQCRWRTASMPGYDRARFKDIGDYCSERWSWERASEFGAETRERQAVRKAYIPKPNEKRWVPATAAIRGRPAILAVLPGLITPPEPSLPAQRG